MDMVAQFKQDERTLRLLFESRRDEYLNQVVAVFCGRIFWAKRLEELLYQLEVERIHPPDAPTCRFIHTDEVLEKYLRRKT